MTSLIESLRVAARTLRAAGIADAGTDARILLLAASGLDPVALIGDPDRALAPEAAARLQGWLARRARREPVSRILGRREFWGLTLRVTPDVLDPRPDTETLVEAVLRALGARRGENLRILDLGTGSGAILCALLSEMPEARGWAVDRSAGACAVARRNLADHGFAPRSLVLRSDWDAALPSRSFDVVVSNPPYIETEVIGSLDGEVRDHDPLASLDGGIDGLSCYRVLAAALPRLLARCGLAAVEVGQGQARAVMDLFTASGLGALKAYRDLSGISRVVLGGTRNVDVGVPD